MKNYTNNYEERKYFIRNYKIKNGQIIVSLASRKKYVLPYTEENEKNILFKMEEQVRNSYDVEEKNKKGFNKNLEWAVIHFLLATFNGLILLLETSRIPWLTATGFALTSLATAFNTSSCISKQLILSDIKKTNFFLENKRELNKKSKGNKKVLSGISKKTTKQIEQTPVDRPVFDINIIDNIPLKDLKTLKANIERDEAFGFKQELVIENTEEKVKKYK